MDGWLDVLGEPSLRREFLNGASDDDQEIMEAFAHANRESALKTKPKVPGFPACTPFKEPGDPPVAGGQLSQSVFIDTDNFFSVSSLG